MAKSNRVMYWFRTDLRLHDSPALHAALALDPAVLWPIFTWDPHYVYRARGGLNRWQYLLDCQADLSASITALNPRSKLLVVREAPQTVLPKLFKAWRVTHLVFEKDTDAYARARDADVVEAARRAGVEVVVRPGRTLWDSDDLVQRNAGKPTMSLAQLQKAAAQMGPVARPLPPPDALPDPGETPLEGVEQDVPAAEPDVNAKWRRAGGGDAPPGRETAYAGASVAGPHADFAIETLAELGYAPATTPHRGGETRALARLADVVADLRYAATFRKPQTSPAAVDAPATTLLSPALHFGALSVRELYWRVRDAVERYKKEGGAKAEAPSQPPESLEGQLLFRDMYFAAQAAIGPKFTQEAGNPHCRFVPWHLPSRLDDEGMTTFEYEVDDPRAEEWFTRWEHGRTGFPWIDALMRQLRQEGWIHHLGRHSVACFLTRGGCYIHWERGAAVFEELLLDHEPACNAGNWQWLSCTAFFAQFYRVYSPVSFPQRWDKHGAFVRRWVPELARLDARFIYEPWKAPVAAQRKAGVRIVGAGAGLGGGDDEDKGLATYPKPMFDFGARRTFCLAAMKKAYAAGLRGDDKRLADKSGREQLYADRVDPEMEGGHADSSDDGADADEADHAGTGRDGHGRKAEAQRKTARPSQGAGSSHGQKRDQKKQGTLDRVVKRQKKG